MALRLSHLAYGAAVLLPLAAAATSAAAAGDTFTIAIAAGNFGTVAAPLTYSGTVTVAASGGAISISPTGAAHVNSSDIFTVTVTCTGTSNRCNTSAATVTIANVGTPAGRLGAASNFTAVAANVYPPIAVANTAAMQFGAIVKPASGSGTVTLTTGIAIGGIALDGNN